MFRLQGYDIEHGMASCSKDNGLFSQREGPSCDRSKEIDSGYASKSAKGAKQKLAKKKRQESPTATSNEDPKRDDDICLLFITLRQSHGKNQETDI